MGDLNQDQVSAARRGPSVHWQTTISERGGMICLSVPHASKEGAMLMAQAISLTRLHDGRVIAPDAEVLVELWDEEAGRALERTLLKAGAEGVVEASRLPTEQDPASPTARPAKKLRKAKKRGRPRGRRI